MVSACTGAAARRQEQTPAALCSIVFLSLSPAAAHWSDQTMFILTEMLTVPLCEDEHVPITPPPTRSQGHRTSHVHHFYSF